MATPLEPFLRDLWTTHASGEGVAELAHYPALRNLLEEVGKHLTPAVRCVMNLRNVGAGLPDGGLFTPDQLRDTAPSVAGGPPFGQSPARGAIEAKAPAVDVDAIVASEQVARYVARYGQVLVTNLREFVVVASGPDGRPLPGERYRLADTPEAFWDAARTARTTDRRHGERFGEFLQRVMLRPAPLTRPRDVAWYLASYAREARGRVEGQQLSALATLRGALEESLRVSFKGERGVHLFRSTLVQTLFYGVFSAWVLWSRRHPDDGDTFDWHEAAWFSSVPMIGALFEQVGSPSRLRPLGLVEVLDWVAQTLNRVDRAAFFAIFEEGQAVQYFYEPFLREFDPELRKDLGVWYTPHEVVRYMVERVDRALVEELGIADGLADPRVVVLDPCCGTGSYLVEVIKRIAVRLQQRGADALSGQDLKRAVMRRVVGFEILPAPFVVAHLQIGLLLEGLGVPLVPEKHERAAVYLTNALTGWTGGDGPRQLIMLPELAEERDAAEHVKRDAEILVVLGNPPYNGYPGLAMAEERDLTDAYRIAQATRQPLGRGLNDLYVRFFRMAERRIVEGTGRGVVCLISNYSWLDGLSYPAMRERYLEAFDGIWIDNLNGDKFKTGKLTPEGEPDPSVFSTEQNREGIQVGTAVATMVRREQHAAAATVHYREFWGRGKRAELLHAADHGGPAHQKVSPAPELGLPFMPARSGEAYLNWPLLPQLFPAFFSGIMTSRDDVVMDIDRDRLEARMQRYFDPKLDDAEIARLMPGAMANTARFDAAGTRKRLVERGFLPYRIMRYCYRPFDARWLYWEPETKLLDEKREGPMRVFNPGSRLLISRPKAERQREGIPFYVASAFPDLHLIRPSTTCFVWDSGVGVHRQSGLSLGAQAPAISDSNLSPAAVAYLASLRDEGLQDLADDLRMHALAVGCSGAYLTENQSALTLDWPRVPLPRSADALRA
ncbi:MAG TPA: type ISP restriction/modification enzyme, partial [Thermomicrobiaceae bacterium]|nr:type ISP restriction/modification enzyme [Thermomicrobiaceae bacterium]